MRGVSAGSVRWMERVGWEEDKEAIVGVVEVFQKESLCDYNAIMRELRVKGCETVVPLFRTLGYGWDWSSSHDAGIRREG